MMIEGDPIRERIVNETEDVAFIDMIPPAFRTENTLGSFMTSDLPPRLQKFDPEFNPFDHIEGYEADAEAFAYANNADQVGMVKSHIEREKADRALIQQSGVTGVAAMIVAGVFDPVNLIPVGGTAYKTYRVGGKILDGAMTTAKAGFLSSTAAEALLHQTQTQRTLGESAVNMAGSTFLSGVLGGTVGALRDFNKVSTAIEKELVTGEKDIISPNQIVITQDELIADTTPSAMPARAAPSESVSEDVIAVDASMDDILQYTRKYGSSEELLRNRGVPDDLLDMAAFGISEKSTKTLLPKDLNIIWKDDLAQVEFEISKADSPEAWAREVSLVEPVEVDLDDAGKLVLQDGHHRYMAAKILGKELNVDLTIKANSIKALAEKLDIEADYDSVTRALFDMGDTKPKVTDAQLDEIAQPELGDSSIGAAQTNTSNEKLKSALGLENIGQDPMLRLSTSGSISSRRTVQQLAETPLTYEKNADGIPTAPEGSVEARIRSYQAPLYVALKNHDDQFIQYRKGRSSRFADRLVIGMKDTFARGTQLTRTEFNAEITKAMRRGDKHDIPEVANAARGYREHFDRIKKEAIDLGLLSDADVKTADSYMTRIYNKEKIIEQRNVFRAITVKYLKNQQPDLDLIELEDIADQLIGRIIGTPDGRLPYDVNVEPNQFKGKGGKSGVFKARKFLIDDTEIEAFLENDIEMISRIHTRSTSADIEMMREFGDLEMTTQKKEIEEDWDRKINASTSAKDKVKFEKSKKKDIRDMAAIRDRLQGTYMLPDDPSAIAPRAAKFMKNLNYLRLLGGMTISAVPDAGKMVMYKGLAPLMKDGIGPYIRNFKAARLAAEEVKLAGTALDMVMDSRTLAIADVMDDFGRYSRFERGVQYLTDNFGMVSLMAPWNAAMKQTTGLMVQTNILRASKNYSGASKADIERLAASGIGEDMAKKISKQFANHGGEQDGIFLPNTLAWTDKEAIGAFRRAIARDVDRTIVTPGQDKPLWVSTSWGNIMGQFKSFAFASFQRTTLTALQQRDFAALQGAVFMTTLGSLTYGIKQKQAGRELSDDPRVWITEGIDRSGLTAWAFDVNNIMEKATRGRVGVNALIGGPPMSRYASRNIAGALFGPSYGLVEDFIRTTGAASAGDWKPSDTHALRRLLPFQNLIGLRQVMDQTEGSVNNALGIRK